MPKSPRACECKITEADITIKNTSAKERYFTHIDYCKLHANAARLRDALEESLTMIEPMQFPTGVSDIKSLLRKCRGEK